MANYCTQLLYIVAKTEDDIKELLYKMAANLKATTGKDVLSNFDSRANWDELAEAIVCSEIDYDVLGLLDEDPYLFGVEGGFSYGTIQDKPYIAIDACLKWSPSYQVYEFCSELDVNRYGCASINGGETHGWESACIQSSPKFGDPTDGIVRFEEFSELRKRTERSTSKELGILALKALFGDIDDGGFFNRQSDDDVS